jgi:hypothetical protein
MFSLEIRTTCEPSGIAIIASYGIRVLYQTGHLLQVMNKNELRTLINLFEYQELLEPGNKSHKWVDYNSRGISFENDHLLL